MRFRMSVNQIAAEMLSSIKENHSGRPQRLLNIIFRALSVGRISEVDENPFSDG
jgi:hypothetical protein